MAAWNGFLRDSVTGEPTVSRLLVALVKQQGGVVRLSASEIVKPDTGDVVIVEQYGDEYVLRVDSDDALRRQVEEAVHGVREMIYDLEVRHGDDS